MDAQTRYRTRLAVQMIFQNPHASLNPRLRVDRIVGDALRIHKLVPAKQWDDKVSELLLTAGLDPRCVNDIHTNLAVASASALVLHVRWP